MSRQQTTQKRCAAPLLHNKYLLPALTDKFDHFRRVDSEHPSKFAIKQTLRALHNGFVRTTKLLSAPGKLRPAVMQCAY